MAQLAFQIQNNNIEGAGDELLKDIIDEGRKIESVAGVHLLSFAARCLEFMVPRPKTAREVTTACVERCMNWEITEATAAIQRLMSAPMEIFPGLVSCAIENRPIVAGTLQEILTDRINNGQERESTLAIDLAMHLMWFFHLGRKGQEIPSEVSDFWRKVSDAIYAACSERLQLLSPRYLLVCNEVFNRRRIGILEMKKWHGIEAIFRPLQSLVFPHFWSWSPASTLLFVALSSPLGESEGEVWEVLQLRELARTLLDCRTPWIQRGVEKRLAFPTWVLQASEEKRKHVKRKRALDTETMFGAFLVSATPLEATEDSEMLRLVQALRETQVPMFIDLAPLLLARVEQADPSVISRAIDRVEFDAAQRAFIEKWIRRELSIVGPEPSEGRETAR